MSFKPNPKQRPCLKQSNKAIVAFLNEHYGLPVRDARAAVHGLIMFIGSTLKSGKHVTLHTLGTFQLRTKKARHFTNNFGTFSTQDSTYIRWLSSKGLRHKLNPKK